MYLLRCFGLRFVWYVYVIGYYLGVSFVRLVVWLVLVVVWIDECLLVDWFYCSDDVEFVCLC